MSRILMSQLRVGADLRFFFDIGKVFKNALTYLVFFTSSPNKSFLAKLGEGGGNEYFLDFVLPRGNP